MSYLDKNGLTYYDSKIKDWVYDRVNGINDNEVGYEKIVPNKAKAVAVNSVGGKSVVWNQLVNPSFESSVQANITFSWDGVYLILNGTSNVDIWKSVFASIAIGTDVRLLRIKHISGNASDAISWYWKGTGEGRQTCRVQNGLYTREIFSPTDSVTTTGILGGSSNITFTNFKLQISVINLTKMYGTGNEPTELSDPRIAAIEAYLADHPEYNEGEIVSAEVQSVVSNGKNLWDEQTVLGYYNDSGVWQTRNDILSAKNHISVEPSTNYYVTFYSSTFVTFWDSNKSFISRSPNLGGNDYKGKFTTPSNCHYILFNLSTGYGAVYNHDVAILKGDSGTYSPYVGTLGTLTIPSALRTAHPLRSAGTVYDEYDFARMVYIKRVGVEDLGMLAYTYASAETTHPHFMTTSIDDRDVRTGVVNSIVTEYDIFPNGATLSTIQGQMDITNNPTIYFQATGVNVRILNRAYTDVSAFKSAMSGIILYYELAEPLYYYDPTSPELAVNGGTVVPDATHIIDAKSYFPNDNSVLVEGGGTVTFHQVETEFPIPNSLHYSYISANDIPDIKLQINNAIYGAMEASY